MEKRETKENGRKQEEEVQEETEDTRKVYEDRDEDRTDGCTDRFTDTGFGVLNQNPRNRNETLWINFGS